MSYLTIQRTAGNINKEINIISLQQVVGRHINLDYNTPVRVQIFKKSISNSDKFKIKTEKIFSVLGPNNQDITLSGNGKSPWLLLIGHKNVRQSIRLLLIGNKIWGIELDQGMKMKREATRLGPERINNFLKKQIDSMIETPEKWESIEVYLRE